MSLPGGQQRILDGIAGTLQTRDPRLASMFAIFTRLNHQEPMPADEELTAGRLSIAMRRLRQAFAPGRRPAWLVIPALMATVACLILIPLAGSSRLCGPALGGRFSAPAAAHRGNCGAAGQAPVSGHLGH
jgi:hypothetical protein